MAHVNPSRINFLFKFARSGRLSLHGWAAVLVALWLTLVTGNIAWGRETDYIHRGNLDDLETVGRYVEGTTP